MRRDYIMNERKRKVSVFDKEKIIAAILLVIILILIGFGLASYCLGEEPLATCYAMCGPTSRVNIRRSPDKNSMIMGYLEPGDSFKTDGNGKNGYITCYGAGENGYVYVGYVSTEEPQVVFEQYVCVAKKQVACRSCIGGELIHSRPWLKNGQNCYVYYIGDEWACTNCGFIRAEYLEVDPK